MITKHTPATPLPWIELPYKPMQRTPQTIAVDDAYELHAANAYPRLVEALRTFVKRVEIGEIRSKKTYASFVELLRELGEE